MRACVCYLVEDRFEIFTIRVRTFVQSLDILARPHYCARLLEHEDFCERMCGLVFMKLWGPIFLGSLMLWGHFVITGPYFLG